VSRPTPAAGVKVAVLVCALIGPSLVLVSGSQARDHGRAASAAPAQLVHSAVRDAVARGSVHLVESVRLSATVKGTISGDIAAHDGQQAFRLSGVGDMRVEVVGGIAYVTGSRQALVDVGGLSAALAAKAAAHWVSISPSNGAYATVAGGVTLSSALSEFMPQGALKELAPSSVDGQAVLGIRGAAGNGAGTKGETITVYVSRSSKPLPVRVVFGVSGGAVAVGTVDLSRWGGPVSIKAPSGALPIDSP
jgi:hypothetical protein